MKIAFALDHDRIALNFGACNHYRLVTLENQKILDEKDLYDEVNTHKLRPAFLRSLGVDTVVINGMGVTAYELCMDEGLACFEAQGLSYDEALNAALNNQLKALACPKGPHC